MEKKSSQNPQLRANHIINQTENLRSEAEELCKNNEVRLETRLELVSIYGLQTANINISDDNIDLFAHFKYSFEEPDSDKVNTAFAKFKKIKRDYTYYSGDITEIATTIGDAFHFALNQAGLSDTTCDAGMEAIQNSVFEAFLNKFVNYVYEYGEE